MGANFYPPIWVFFKGFFPFLGPFFFCGFQGYDVSGSKPKSKKGEPTKEKKTRGIRREKKRETN